MAKYLLTFIIFIVSLSIFAQSPSTGNINVVVTGLKADTGVARIGLVNNEADLMNDDATPFMGAAQTIVSGSTSYMFKNVPYGIYVIKVFHDEDNSGKLKKGMFGIPKEEYGFSNNVYSKSFKKASFDLNQPNVELNIKVK